MEILEYPVLIHCESGYKALIEDERTMTYWLLWHWNGPWDHMYVPVDSPLIKYNALSDRQPTS